MIAALYLKRDLPISVSGLETFSCSISLMLLDVFCCIKSFRMLGPLTGKDMILPKSRHAREKVTTVCEKLLKERMTHQENVFPRQV